MNLEELRWVPTKDLIEYLGRSLLKQDQSLVNMYAYELTYRLWCPESEKTFEETLSTFGYKKINVKTKTKKK